MTSKKKHHGPTAILLLEYYDFLSSLGYVKQYRRQLASRMQELVSIIGSEKLLSTPNKEVFGIIENSFSVHSAPKAKCAYTLLKLFVSGPVDNETPFSKALEKSADKIYKMFAIYVFEERRLCKEYAVSSLQTYRKLTEFLLIYYNVDIHGLTEPMLIRFLSERELTNSFATKMRSILRFLYRESILKSDMSHLVLTKKKRPGRAVKYLKPEQINQILEATPKFTPVEKRDYAMFMLMARMGLRVGELFRIRLDDIDWVRGKLRVRGKAGKIIWLPLPQDAGDAIVAYLKSSDRSESQILFLSAVAPFRPLSLRKRPNHVLKKVVQSLDVRLPDFAVKTKVFRHSFATQKLKEGYEITHVRDLLRHENVAMTQVYAKYSIEPLRELVRPWAGEC